MNNQKGPSRRAFILALIILTIVNVTVLLVIRQPVIQQASNPGTSAETIPPGSRTSNPSKTTPISSTIQINPTNTISAPTNENDQGIIVISIRDGNYNHLFTYHPLYFPLTRLTNSNWDDISPDVSPDGTKIAFSSRKNGFWDIYILDLETNLIMQVSDTPEYDSSPTWSPDGQWLAYESYIENNLEILIRSVADLSQPILRLTTDPAADFSPAWSPQGREIAFVSTRTGEEEIWIARLDLADDRFFNISKNPNQREFHPTWSPSGNYLAWSSKGDSIENILIWSRKFPTNPPFSAGNGSFPVWGPDENFLLTEIDDPGRTFITAYNLNDGSLLFPLTQLPGHISGISWRANRLYESIKDLPITTKDRVTITPLWYPLLTLTPQPPNGRKGIVQLIDVTAPYPYLNDEVNEAFENMRLQLGNEIGWDFLASLENAYIPLTEPPAPGMEENWLFTGRAFAINTLPMNAGWMVVMKENYAGQIYWRVYIKTRYQDGSQGTLLEERSWSFDARYTGDPTAYEHGGQYGTIPPGYWVDFTELASRFGWQRLPALENWRTYYPGARFNQFVIYEGLDWNMAMGEVYPPEALVTATYRPTFNPSNTFTPGNKETTSTPKPPITATPTIKPSWTLPSK